MPAEERSSTGVPPPEAGPPTLNVLAGVMPGLVFSLYKVLRWLLDRREFDKQQPRGPSHWR